MHVRWVPHAAVPASQQAQSHKFTSCSYYMVLRCQTCRHFQTEINCWGTNSDKADGSVSGIHSIHIQTPWPSIKSPAAWENSPLCRLKMCHMCTAGCLTQVPLRFRATITHMFLCLPPTTRFWQGRIYMAWSFWLEKRDVRVQATLRLLATV